MSAWFVLEYFGSSQMFLTHLIGGGLAYSFVKREEGAIQKRLIIQVVIVEILAFLLWCLIPGGFATITTLAIVLYWYEFIAGPRVVIYEKASFCSPEDIFENVVTQGIQRSEFTPSKLGGSKFKFTTDLKYIEHYGTVICRNIKDKKGLIEVTDIAHIAEGCHETAEKHTAKKGFKPEQCFHVVLGPGEKIVSFIAKDEKCKDQWVTALRDFFIKGIEMRTKNYMEEMFQKSDVDESGLLDFKESVFLLNNMNRSTDKAYIKELFNVFTGVPGTKTEPTPGSISVEQFQRFYDVSGKKPEITEVFSRLTKQYKVLSLPAFRKFLSQEQKETLTDSICNKWIEKCEVICPFYNLSSIGFTNFLLSEDQIIFNREHRKVYQSMDQPLSHYFIATSHNTYLTKDQLKGKSSVDAYISAFQRGCKCVELDCWDGPNNEPIIYHGHTLTSKILFKDVIQAINDYAFCISSYPVILSFENHCSVDQQMVMAHHLSEILGDKIYTTPMPDTMKELPSPHELQGKIICKTKKLKENQDPADDFFDYDTDEDEDGQIEEELAMNNNKNASPPASGTDIGTHTGTTSPTDTKSKSSIKSFFSTTKKSMSSSKPKEKRPKIAQELSDLVIFCQAVHFHSFQHSKEKHKFYEMSSFAEKKAMKFSKDEAPAFIEYNQRQFSRIYPAGSRVDSSNYDPVPLWNIGSQLVALNYQTPGRSMQLNQGLFAANGFCGYVLKPDFLRHSDVDHNHGSKPGVKCTIKVISGSQLPFSNEASLKKERQLAVQVRISGAEVDNKKERTRNVKNNGYNPMWNDELNFHVRVPELALVTFTVKEGDNFLAAYTLPFTSMMQGYRRVPLQDKASEELQYCSLFVYVTITPNLPE